MNNIVQKYINDVKRRFKQYCSLILKSKYDSKISEILINEYIDLRYYNYGFTDTSKAFYKKIYDSMLEKAEKMKKDENQVKPEIIDYTVSLFQYFFYFDFVRNNLPVETIVEKIQNKRVNEFNLKSAENDDFVKIFTEKVRYDIDEVNLLLISYKSSFFDLNIEKLDPKEKDYYYVSLNYDIPFPEIFSEIAIRNTFNEGLVAEDKLFVEYPMLAIQILKDLISCDFKKKYIADFSIEIFGKAKKMENLLEILNSPVLQEKLLFRLPYNTFTTCKKDVIALIRKGFNFVLITDDNMEKLSSDELNLLKIFSTVIADAKDINIKKYTNEKIIIK